MKYWSYTNGRYVSMGKKECRRLKVNNLSYIFNNFLKLNYTDKIVDEVLEQLDKMYSTLEHNHEFRMYGGSLLIVYDSMYNSENMPNKVKLKLIDFAHTYKLEDKEQDDGFLYGLHSLKQVIKNIKNLKL